MIGAPTVAATFQRGTMRDTNSALDGSIGAPTVAATFLLGTMREANSALDSLIRPKTYFTIDSETSCTYFGLDSCSAISGSKRQV